MFCITNCNKSNRFLATCSAMVFCSVIWMQTPAMADDMSFVKQEFEKTFNKMLDNPADVSVTMRYANLAVQLENYEAAIPPLERILMFNPDLPLIKQKLGVLYYRLNSPEMAKTYFLDSKKGKNVSPEVVAEADKYLAKLN